MPAMSSLLPFALMVALAAVLAVLLAGVFTMARGGEFNRRHGNNLMRLRVGLQLVAVLLFVLVILVFRA